MRKIFLVLILAMVGCGKTGTKSLERIREEVVPQYVNQKNVDDHNLTLDKHIYNASYPIYIALYSDGNFYYDLPRLGDGTGTWKNSNGIFKLKAKRPIFDMYIEVGANDSEGKSLSISFSDRFGPKTLKMVNSNIE